MFEKSCDAKVEQNNKVLPDEVGTSTLSQARLLRKAPVGDATWAASKYYVSGSGKHLR